MGGPEDIWHTALKLSASLHAGLGSTYGEWTKEKRKAKLLYKEAQEKENKLVLTIFIGKRWVKKKKS